MKKKLPTSLERFASAIGMPAEHVREAAENIRREQRREALLEKVRLIRERNAAILPTGEIVPRGTPGAMNFDSPEE